MGKSKEFVPYTEEELDYMQPAITKLMRGLQKSEKVIVLRDCIKQHFMKKGKCYESQQNC